MTPELLKLLDRLVTSAVCREGIGDINGMALYKAAAEDSDRLRWRQQSPAPVGTRVGQGPGVIVAGPCPYIMWVPDETIEQELANKERLRHDRTPIPRTG